MAEVIKLIMETVIDHLPVIFLITFFTTLVFFGMTGFMDVFFTWMFG